MFYFEQEWYNFDNFWLKILRNELSCTYMYNSNWHCYISQLLLQLLIAFSSLKERSQQMRFLSLIYILMLYLTSKTKTLTLHLEGSQAVNHPVKVGGSNPCLIKMIGVSRSLSPGCVRKYSWLVTTASLRSTSLASLPIQRNN